MAKRMTDLEFKHFVDTVAGVALANHGMIACALAGVPPTMENVIAVAGRVVNPSSPHFESMALAVEHWRAHAVEMSNSLRLDNRRARTAG